MRKANEKEILDQDKRLKKRMANVKNKIIVMSGKGGVGKTTVAVNLAYELSTHGYDTGILDVDIHGPNIAKMLGVEGKRLYGSESGIEPFPVSSNLRAVSVAMLMENKDQPIVWRGPLKMITIKQFLSEVNWGKLDYLIIDSPPGTGDEPLSVCQLIPDISGAIIVTTSQGVAILDSRKSILFAKELGVDVIGVIENMSGFLCPHCKKEIDLFGKGGGKKAALELKVPFLGKIPIDPEIVTSSDSGMPFIHFKKESITAQKMRDIVEKITAHGENFK